MCGTVPGAWFGTAVVLNSSTGVGSACPQPPSPPPAPPSARSVLLTIKQAAATWPAGLPGWSTSGPEPCVLPWPGVSCAAGAVTDVDLGFYTMQGTLPSGLADLGTQLTSLTLAGGG